MAATGNKRIYELAKELGVETKAILIRLREVGIQVKDHLAVLKADEEDKARKLFETPKAGEPQVKKMEGGRVVRRRAGSAVATPVEAAPPTPVPAVMPVTDEAKVPEVVEAPPPVEPATEPAAVPVEAPVEAPAAEQPEPIAAAELPEATPPALPEAPAPAASPAVVAPTAKPAEVKPAERGPIPPEAIKTLAEPDKKGKQKRLVYDRRRDVITLREFKLSPSESDEADHVEQRPPSRRRKQNQRMQRRPQRTVLTTPREQKRVIRMEGDVIQVGELAHHLGVKATDIVRKLMSLGVMASVTQMIDYDTAAILASEFGYTVEKVGFDPASLLKELPDGELELKQRPPVVTIMGHVDHGKTTLLDYIRKTHVVDAEAGGITQHIGAYKVRLPGGDIVFLDTPGHEAFTAMRARGAKVTDLVILVVAADDGVKAQTLEAIAHAKEANVPIVVAVNKVDKPEAQPDRTRRELSDQGLIPEEWGGPNIFVDISAKQGKGVDSLLEMLLLQAQVLDLKANPDKPGRGVVLESRLDRQVGPIATMLVQSGTLKIGDMVVTGLAHGRIRKMLDDQGKPMTEAHPSEPVRVVGLDMVPNAGDLFLVMPDERQARELASWQLEQQKKSRGASSGVRVSLEDFHAMVQSGTTKDLKIILRTDVQGSLGALTEAIAKLKHPEINVRIIHNAVGAVTEGDVNLAMAANAVIIGFNVPVDPKAQSLADQEKVDIKRYSIIYDVIDELKKAMEGLLTPKSIAKLAGKAVVRQVFNLSKYGKIAGVMVTSGHVIRSAEARVMRSGEKVFTGKLASLKHFKDDVREVKQGFECGLSVEGYDALEVGDEVEFYEIEMVRPTLDAAT